MTPRRDAAGDGAGRLGFGLVAAHLLTVWALALSNGLLGLAILWSVRSWRRLRPIWERAAPILAPLGLYAVFCAASVLFSYDPRASLEELGELFSLATVPLVLWWVRGERPARRIYDLLILTAALLAVHGLAQYLLTDFGPLHNRIRGPFSHYMTFSGVLLVGDFLLVGRLATGDGWRQPLHWLGFAVLNAALLLTLTRSAWVAALVTLTVLVAIRARRYFVVYAAAVAVAAVLLFTLAPDAWTARVRSIVDPLDGSNYDRLCMAQAGLYMISERPLLGLGPGMVEERYPIYRHPTAPRTTVPHLHNTFLQLAAERGLLSLAAYLWLMMASLALAYRGYRREGGAQGARADLYLGALLALVAFNLAGLFEANWRDTEVQRLALFLLAVPACLRPGPDESSRRGEVA